MGRLNTANAPALSVSIPSTLWEHKKTLGNDGKYGRTSDLL